MPFGLGYEIDAINAIIDERKSAEARAQRPKFLADNDGPLTGEEKDSIGNDVTDRVIERGNNADYLTARIARDRPDILDRMKAGEFTSVRAAAKEAGIVAPEVRFRRAVPLAVRALRRHFTVDELAEIKAGLSLRTTAILR